MRYYPPSRLCASRLPHPHPHACIHGQEECTTSFDALDAAFISGSTSKRQVIKWAREHRLAHHSAGDADVGWFGHHHTPATAIPIFSSPTSGPAGGCMLDGKGSRFCTDGICQDPPKNNTQGWGDGCILET